MASLPTHEEVERAIFDAIASYNVRANEIVPLIGVHTKLQTAGFRADDINPALQRMVDSGLITIDGSPFLKLTDAGFAAM